MSHFSRSAEAYGLHSRPAVSRLLRALHLDVEYPSGSGDYLTIEPPIADGRDRVLDMVGGFGGSVFGHNHPVLVEAMQDTIRRARPFNAQGSVRAGAARLASRLSEAVGATTGDEYIVTFAATGAGAVEAAIKHATLAHRRHLATLQEELERTLRRARRDGIASRTLPAGTLDLRCSAGRDGDRSLEDLLTEAITLVDRVRHTDGLFVSLSGAFHGKTSGALALTDTSRQSDDIVSGSLRAVQLQSLSPADIACRLDTELQSYCHVSFRRDGTPAGDWRTVSPVVACIVEPIQGEGGVRPIPAETIEALRAEADCHNAALIFDEIQSGMGRTGDFLASAMSGVVGDYYLLGKALGGGIAKLSALLVPRDQYIDDFGRYHTSTFADDDHSAQVALAALDLLAEDDGALLDRIRHTGGRLRSRLDDLARRWPNVLSEVRGRGLLIGIELIPPSPRSSFERALVDQELFGYVVAGHLLHRHAVRILPTLSAPNTLRVEPSAFVRDADIDVLIDALDKTCAVIERRDTARLVDHLAETPATYWPVPTGTPRPRSHPIPEPLPWGAPRRVAFLANFSSPGDLRSLAPELASFDDAACEALLDRARGALRPFPISTHEIRSPCGEQIEFRMIGVPFTAAQLEESRRDASVQWITDLVAQAVDDAVADGAVVVGLGGYTSIVTDAGRSVVEDDVVVTTGNALTAACAHSAISAWLDTLAKGDRSVGIVGAYGNIGAVLAELVAHEVDSLMLVGRRGSQRRLAGLAARLGIPAGLITISTDMADLRRCRTIVTATNAARPVIRPEHIGDGPTLVYDLAVPGDVDSDVRALCPDVVVLQGGRIELPLDQQPCFAGTNLEAGTTFACMAETMLLGFDTAAAPASYGSLTTDGVRSIAHLADRHHFRFVSMHTPTSFSSTQTPPMEVHAMISLDDPNFPVDAAGSKAANLHRMLQAGFRVPPGFVVLPDVDVDEVTDAQLADAVEAVGGFPVAARSSGMLEDLADASFAGQYETYLGISDVATLRQRIGDCRCSGGNDRVQAYLKSRDLTDPKGDHGAVHAADVTVLVQRLVDASVAGVGFSIDPLLGKEEHGIVESCQGLGERLVSGHTRPTRHVLDLATGSVVGHDAGDEHVDLTDAQTAELARLLLDVSVKRGYPQDIEWAIDGDGMLWLLQARPITSIRWRTDVDQYTSADLRDGGVSARVCTPLMFSLYRNAFCPTMQQYFEDLKLLDPATTQSWMDMFYMRPYWNASAVKRCLAAVPGYDEESFDKDLGIQKDYGDAGPARTPTNVRTIAGALPTAVALERLYDQQLVAVEEFAAAWPPLYRSWCERAGRITDVQTGELERELCDCLRTFHAYTERTYFATIFNNSNVQTDFKKFVDKLDVSIGGTTDVLALMGGLAEISHMALERGIVSLYACAARHGIGSQQWHDALDGFIAEHGFHADAELDLTCPRWSEEPNRVERMIRAMLNAGTRPADPDETEVRQLERFEAEFADVKRRIGKNPLRRVRWGRGLDKHVTRMRTYLVARERMRELSTQAYAIVRRYVLEAGCRFAADGRLPDVDAVFMLHIDELCDLTDGRLDGDDVADRITYRRAMYLQYRDLVPPNEFGGGVTQAAGQAALSDGELRGLGCSSGTAQGTVRVIADLDEVDQLQRGDILVTRFTDPGWTPALGVVAGVITEVGGMLSHAAVIGREYGIPAVLNLQGATTLLRSGQRVAVDGTTGVVKVLDAMSNEDVSIALEGRAGETTVQAVLSPGGSEPIVQQRRIEIAIGGTNERKPIVCITGGDGSGKTTQIARLAAELGKAGVTVAPITIWDAFLDPATSSKLPFAKPADVYGYLQLLEPVARTHFLYHSLHLALDLASQRRADVLLVNSHWYKYFATEAAYGGDLLVLRQLAAGFFDPDLTFYLRLTPEEALERKQRRTDYESGYGTDDEAFLRLQSSSHKTLDALADELDWIEIPATEQVDDITARMLGHIEVIAR